MLVRDGIGVRDRLSAELEGQADSSGPLPNLVAGRQTGLPPR